MFYISTISKIHKNIDKNSDSFFRPLDLYIYIHFYIH